MYEDVSKLRVMWIVDNEENACCKGYILNWDGERRRGVRPASREFDMLGVAGTSKCAGHGGGLKEAEEWGRGPTWGEAGVEGKRRLRRSLLCLLFKASYAPIEISLSLPPHPRHPPPMWALLLFMLQKTLKQIQEAYSLSIHLTTTRNLLVGKFPAVCLDWKPDIPQAKSKRKILECTR